MENNRNDSDSAKFIDFSWIWLMCEKKTNIGSNFLRLIRWKWTIGGSFYVTNMQLVHLFGTLEHLPKSSQLTKGCQASQHKEQNSNSHLVQTNCGFSPLPLTTVLQSGFGHQARFGSRPISTFWQNSPCFSKRSFPTMSSISMRSKVPFLGHFRVTY